MGNTPQHGNSFEELTPVPENPDVDRNKKYWKLYRSSMNNGETLITIFEFRDPTPNRQLYKYSVNSAKILKTFRHPYILPYKSGYQRNDCVYVASTPVDPLIDVLPSLSYSERLYGVRNIAEALSFLNSEKCRVSHNNIQLNSIYVTRSKLRRWVLGDFEFSCSHKDMLKNKSFLKKSESFRLAKLPPNFPHPKKVEQMYTIDIFSFVNFVEFMFRGLESKFPDQSLPKFVESVKRGCVSPKEIGNVPTFESFLHLSLFKKDEFTYVMSFMDNMRAYKSPEKEEFFGSLYSRLLKIPIETITKRLVKRMLSVSFLTDVHCHEFLPHLFSPLVEEEHEAASQDLSEKKNGFLPKNIYNDVIGGFLNILYSSRNRALRLKVIQTIPHYISHVEPSFIIQVIIPELLSGIYDVDDEIVKSTITSFATITRYLQQYDLSRRSGKGMELVNKKILPHLHHWSVKGAQVRPHAILSMCGLWDVRGIRKDIILSSMQSGLYDMENHEIQLHVVNALALHFKKFNVVEIVNIVVPSLLHMSVHEQDEVRLKAIRTIKLILDDNYENRKNYRNIPRLNKLPKPSSYYPVSSRSSLVRSSKFKGGKYRSMSLDYSDESDDGLLNGGARGSLGSSGRRSRRKGRKYDSSSESDSSSSSSSSGISSITEEEEEEEEMDEKKKTKKDSRNVSLVKKNDSGGEWMSLDVDEEKEKIRIANIVNGRKNRGEKKKNLDDDDEDADDWDDWDLSPDDPVEDEKKEEDKFEVQGEKNKIVQEEEEEEVVGLFPDTPEKTVRKEEIVEEKKEKMNGESFDRIQENVIEMMKKKKEEEDELERQKRKEEEELERQKKKERDAMIDNLEKKMFGNTSSSSLFGDSMFPTEEVTIEPKQEEKVEEKVEEKKEKEIVEEKEEDKSPVKVESVKMEEEKEKAVEEDGTKDPLGVMKLEKVEEVKAGEKVGGESSDEGNVNLDPIVEGWGGNIQ